jgi:carboxyl-terminal processing protease
MKKIWQVLSYVLVAALATVITLAATSGSEPQSKLDQLEELIDERFIGEVDQAAIEDAAARAMVDALGDRWSYYLSAQEYQDYKEQMANSYVGIGITIQVTEDGKGYLITKVNEGGPAEAAGLLPGDRMVAVAGQSVLDKDTTETRDLVRGKEGTFVDITVVRNGEEMTFPVERKQVQTPVATAKLLDNHVGLITIVNFDSRCADETIDAIEEMLDQGADALIFDVRFNPGGYAKELVKVLDYLLPKGDLFRTVNYKGDVSVDTSDAKCLEIPMAVLVNGSSYSAAEFFAVALSEYEAAVVVGEKTCGKGYYQVTMELNDGSAVGLSIGEYFTPKGKNLAGIGITPDVEIPVDEETAAAIYAGTLDPMEDPQIQAALEALNK